MYFEITEHHDYRESLHEITFEPVISLMQLVPRATDLKLYCVQITNKRWNMNTFTLQNDFSYKNDIWLYSYQLSSRNRFSYMDVVYGH